MVRIKFVLPDEVLLFCKTSWNSRLVVLDEHFPDKYMQRPKHMLVYVLHTYVQFFIILVVFSYILTTWELHSFELFAC